MSVNAEIAMGLIIPFMGTALGASMVLFMKNGIPARLQKALLGFASGVMLAALVWSLLIPAMDMSGEQGVTVWLPAAVGLLLGVGFLLLLDVLIPHLHATATVPEGRESKLHKSAMLVLAVTLHNIPEGMAVGVVFAGMRAGNTYITAAAAFALSIGIAIQNFPEGAVVSMPLIMNGASRRKAFWLGVMSGAVEPLSAVLTIMLTALVTPVLPYILAFAAGAMLYVVVEELIPDAQTGEHTDIGTIGLALGFVAMLILDTALG